MEWNSIISNSKQLNTERKGWDQYSPFRLKNKFNFFQGKRVSWDRVCDGICVGPDGKTIIVSDRKESRLDIFSTDGKHVRQFVSVVSMKQFLLVPLSQPMGLCTVGRHILVCDHRDSRIQIFDENYESFLFQPCIANRLLFV